MNDPLRPPRTVCLVGLIAGGHSGVPRYAAKLVEAIDRVAPGFPDLRLCYLTNPAGAAAAPVSSIESTVIRSPGSRANAGPGRLLLEQLSIRGTHADLLHFFDISGPVLARNRRFVTTVHDMSALHGFRRVKNSYKHRLYPWALDRCEAAVAVSQAAKDDVVRHLGVDPEKIVVVHSGPGLAPVSSSQPAAVEREAVLLYVGNIGTNKNLPLVIRAFDRAGPNARLVIAGRPGDGFGAVEAAIQQSSVSDRIELRTRAGDDDVERLYRTAAALVLPSSYEGFGFTPLEAMARGCPVIESDIPALREVSGDGALLVRHDDEAGWAEAISQVLADPELQAELRERGFETVKRYSWETTATRLLELFRSIDLGVARTSTNGG
jgi:glycosyltransferase involved in cell wall biosynthesis